MERSWIYKFDQLCSVFSHFSMPSVAYCPVEVLLTKSLCRGVRYQVLEGAYLMSVDIDIAYRPTQAGLVKRQGMGQASQVSLTLTKATTPQEHLETISHEPEAQRSTSSPSASLWKEVVTGLCVECFLCWTVYASLRLGPLCSGLQDAKEVSALQFLSQTIHPGR